MKCADCKHWTGPQEHRGNGIGECEKAQMYWDSTEWAKDENGEEDYITRIEIDPSNLMYVQDASDYSAYLLTKADFFCAHFEGKEP